MWVYVAVYLSVNERGRAFMCVCMHECMPAHCLIREQQCAKTPTCNGRVSLAFRPSNRKADIWGDRQTGSQIAGYSRKNTLQKGKTTLCPPRTETHIGRRVSPTDFLPALATTSTRRSSQPSEDVVTFVDSPLKNHLVRQDGTRPVLDVSLGDAASISLLRALSRRPSFSCASLLSFVSPVFFGGASGFQIEYHLLYSI